MRLPNFAAILALACLAASASAGRIALFDGKSLEGWQSVGSAEWKVEEGVISGGQFGDPSKSGLLMTEATFKNFDLSLEFKIDEHGKYNSGVYLRHGPGERRQRGYQINIGRGAAEEYVGLHFKEWLDKGDEEDTIRKPLEWNTLRIRAMGAHIESWLNGQKIVDYTDPSPTPQLLDAGAIAFQTYGADGHAGWVKFRNLTITDLEIHSTAVVPEPQTGWAERHDEKVKAIANKQFDLLMIGDSITHNLDRPAYKAVWEEFFAPRNAINLGYSGARTENILWNLQNGELERQSPKVATLLIGTNNTDDANYPIVHSADEVFAGTKAIVELLRERCPDTKILLLRIFPRTNKYTHKDGSPRGDWEKRYATNERAGELCAKLADNKHIFFLDVNDVFRTADGSLDPELMPDLLHPSPTGARKWAEAMEPTLAKLFGDGRAKTPPNIVLFMADDMGMGDTSAYQDFTGNPADVQYKTPNMERLARRGVRFTDAHTPSSRCSPTRYGLLTGRYPWRNRLKHWVLYGSQGDPMIEADRPTIASMLRDSGYRTGMVGKWHVGLRYRQSDGKPAAGWADADLSKPLHTTPIDHGFDYARYTSRSHGTSGPSPGGKKRGNGPKQNVGPGHLHGRVAVGATGDGKRLVDQGPNAYVLHDLGSRHSNHAMQFLGAHAAGGDAAEKPFFLYYPSNSNHGPYTPDDEIGGVKVAGASGDGEDRRRDYVYENDVALGRLIDWLEATDDPRAPGQKLVENTLVIFTSDNGAERDSDIATGPFRSHKGSVYEGGHRVPFIAAWPKGGIAAGSTNPAPIGLQDLFATFAEVVGTPLPDLRAGGKGAEDSFSVLSALRGGDLSGRPPLFFNDHKQAKDDPAVLAMRFDIAPKDGAPHPGQWKILFDAQLLRAGEAHAIELYNLAEDRKETTNLIDEAALAPLVRTLTDMAALHRNAGGLRHVPHANGEAIVFDWKTDRSLITQFADKAGEIVVSRPEKGLTMLVRASGDGHFSPNERGLGISGGEVKQVDAGEAISIQFDRDVLLEHAAIVAGNGQCGGFYKISDAAPLAIYCIDADIDAKDQSGILSDLGVLRAGEALRLDSSPNFGIESPGQWRLGALRVRPLVR